jgi:alpha-ribazole phosphatase/probable phosphoglycerate mutase
VGLSLKGQKQSQKVAAYLSFKPIRAVYSSDLQRAAFAADLIAAEHNLKPEKLEALREVHMGDWEAQTFAEIQKISPELVAELFTKPKQFQYPNGESFDQFYERIDRVFNLILEKHPEGDIAIVAHGGVNRMLLGRALELQPENWLKIAQDYACINIIDWFGNNAIVQKLNLEIDQNLS